MSDYTVPIIINDEERHTPNLFEVVNPSNGQVCHRSVAATPEDAIAAVEASAIALAKWRNSLPSFRRDIFLKAAEIMEKRWKELSEYMTIETGSSEGWIAFSLNNAVDLLRDIAGRVSSIVGTVPTCSDPERSAMIFKEPYGVVFAVVPWNSPYILGMRAIILPIAAGNTVVLKGSELSPRCLWAIVSVLQQAGLPKGVLNFISTNPPLASSVTQAVISHPEVKKITFTGSTAVGRIVATLAAENLKPVVLELGGQGSTIVWDDADLDMAAKCTVAGAFMYAGQCCMSTERVIVHKTVRQEFEKKLLAAIPTVFPSKDELTLMINVNGVDKVQQLLKDAKNKGASMTQIDINSADSSNPANRFQPTILSGVTPDMDIYKCENFGPTASLFEVSTEEEAISIVNDTKYGLFSAVFTEDLRRGLRLAHDIEAGSVHINNMSIHDESVLPHGGCKSSGYGRFNTEVGLSEWLRTKNVTWRK
ncbi:aldehyde dehydrogenase domain-containing protein [Whalleya microplaca]|nr:aldehyde dehydrogenase domain-containing protein [Whalleya microplaca]